MTRRAFTLIEVIAVVVIIGMLATATAWSFTRQAQRSALVDALGAITHTDAFARQAAQRSGMPTALRIDLDHQCLWRVTGAGATLDTRSHTIELPDMWRMEQVVMAADHDRRAASTTAMRRFDFGAVDIPYSTSGRSATFALKVTQTRVAADSGQPTSTWLVFSGITGQVTELHDDVQIDNLFAALATRGPDAD